MWNTSQVKSLPASALPESLRTVPALSALEPNPHAVLLANQQSVVGAGLIVGEISGAQSLKSLFIEGTVQGAINLPGSLVAVGRDRKVNSAIVARDVVVSGNVTGNVTAFNRLEIRAGGSLTGDASAPRISIEDGAFVLGSVQVSKIVEEPASLTVCAAPIDVEPRRAISIRQETPNPRLLPSLKSA